MGAAFIRPLAFVAASTSPAPLAGSVANLALDLPGLVWRGSTSSYLIVDMGATASYDYVALVGCNLRSTDTVQIRTGTTNTGTGGYAGTAQAAWQGFKSDLSTANAIIPLGSTRTERYVRIDITATGHPDGFAQIMRLCVGKAITTLGLAYDAEQGFEDQSVSNTGPGYFTADIYDVLTSWKISSGWITDQSWKTEWFPFLQNVGNSRFFLFIPDDSTPEDWPVTVIYGRITTKASMKAEAYNAWRFEASMLSLFR